MLTCLLQIIRVSYPQNFAGRNLKMCYVEFGDEDAMKSGLAKQGAVSHQPIIAMSTRNAHSLFMRRH